MKNRYFIRLSYKGTNYCGWQKQPDAPSVQETLSNAMSKILREDIIVTGCGRTDTGVHARNFIGHFDSENMDCSKNFELIKGMNAVLPKDIAVYDIKQVSQMANSRFDAISRTYKYYIHTDKDPFIDEISTFIRQMLDIDKMNACCEILYNHTDFTSFSKLHSGNKTNICTITYANWTKTPGGYTFTVTADRFLRNMVRALVGTLILVGTGKLSTISFNEVITAKDRNKAGTSAPPQGLFLEKIVYDTAVFNE